MSQGRQTKASWLIRTFVVLPILLVPTLIYAQNCALCYTQAAGSGHRVIQALRSGILILVAPPMLICIGISVMAYRKRNQFNNSGEQFRKG
jgi:hypothetical protein